MPQESFRLHADVPPQPARTFRSPEKESPLDTTATSNGLYFAICNIMTSGAWAYLELPLANADASNTYW